MMKHAKGGLPMVLWIALLFAGAGRLDWARGWIATAVYVATMAITGALVHRYNPGLLEARGKKMAEDTPKFDKVLLRIYIPLTFVQVLVAGLDAVRFHALPLPPWTTAPGIVLFLAAMGLVCWTMTVNRFAESTVRIQQERGHTVVSSGPYGLVRHPMYVGSSLMYPATALMLGSGWAMAIALPMVLLIVCRTALEDRFLRSELPGYREYAAATRYRLVPGLW